MTALFGLLGAVAGAAILLPFTTAPRPAPPRRRVLSTRGAVAVAAVLAVGVLTGWPVAAALAGVAAYTLPVLLGPDRAHHHTLARIEAVAVWAEDLAGTLRSGAGLEQAITQTAHLGPPAIRAQLTVLAAAPRAGVRLPDALRAFAADLADPTADLVVHVLLQAAHYQAHDLATSLAGVGHAARRQAAARMRIAAGRARIRASTRIIILVVLGTTAAIAVIGHDLTAPYGTPVGQSILAVLGALFGLCVRWMLHLARIPDLPRILTAPPAVDRNGTHR